PGSPLREGDRLHASWYHAALVSQEGIDQAFACLGEAELYDIWQRQVADVERLFHPRGYLIGHDELRAVNSCKACADRHRSAGEAVAESARRAIAAIRKVNPKATIYA